MLDIFADKPQDLDIPDGLIAKYRRLAPEALAHYGSRHFDYYHLLLELSDAIPFQGIEYHRSSDNPAPDDFMTNPESQLAAGDLLTHEFSHSGTASTAGRRISPRGTSRSRCRRICSGSTTA